MTTTPTSGAAIQRYKIGYHADEWGQRSSTPSGIPDASGSWVRYADHVTALAAGQATTAQAGVPAGYVLVPVEALTRWRDAFAEELAAYDLDPPIHHIKESHDEIEAMLAAAPQPTPSPAPAHPGQDGEREAFIKGWDQRGMAHNLRGGVGTELRMRELMNAFYPRGVAARAAPQPATADAVILQLVEALENHGGNYKLTKTEATRVNAAIDAGRDFMVAQQGGAA